MKRLIQSDITKLLIYFALTLVCAAVIAPWLFNLGKFIAEVGESRNLNAVMNWLAQKWSGAGFHYFFIRALIVCAILLAGPFVLWLRLGKTSETPRNSPWLLRLPRHRTASDPGQPLRPVRRGWLHFTTGFLLAGSLLTLMVWLLLVTGWFQLNHPVRWIESAAASIGLAVVLALVSEWFFRGAVFGILLRSLRPMIAMILVSFLFAALHFLWALDNIGLPHPGSSDAGFRLLGLIANSLITPQSYLLSFISIFIAGMILAYARYRTASLWLPIGLHAGWSFVHHVFADIASLQGDHLSYADFLVSPDRKSGLLPLSLLISAGLLVHVFVQITDRSKQTEHCPTTTPPLT